MNPGSRPHTESRLLPVSADVSCRAQMLARMFALLPRMDRRVRLYAPLSGGWLLRAFMGYWFVTDNGGEMGVQRPNIPDSYVAVAYEHRLVLTTAGTLALRVLYALRGEPVDYFATLDTDAEETYLLDIISLLHGTAGC